MKKINRTPEAMRSFECPQCHKRRIIAKPDHKVSQEKRKYKNNSGDDIELFVETCDPCVRINYARHFKPTMADVRRVMDSIKAQKPIDEDKSLEELL